MTLVPDFPNPDAGNPDFQPGSYISSSEVDGNYDWLRDWLNGGNISDVNIAPGGLNASTVLAAGSIVDAQVSSPSDDPPNSGISGLKIQNGTINTLQIADGSVTNAKIADLDGAKLQAGTVPFTAINFPIPSGPGNMQVGTVSFFAGASMPPQNVLCDGQELDEITYAVLDSVLGGIYNNHPQLGPPAPGFFRVPDLLGRVLVGTGTQNNLGDNDTTAEATRNAPTHTHPGTVDLPAIPAHSHTAGTLSGSKTNQVTGQTDENPSYYETGHIIDPTGAAKLVGGVDGLVPSDFSPNQGGAGNKYIKVLGSHTFNITGIGISGSTASGGAYDPPAQALAITAAEMPYMALQPIIYTGV